MLLKRLHNYLLRMATMVNFMLRLSLRERIFIAFFVLSLMFISIINIVFNPSFQQVLTEQLTELQYAFKTWTELALHMGISASSIFVVLIISACFLPITKHAFKRDYLELFMSKPLGLSSYIQAMFWSFLIALFVLIFFWWLFVFLTIYLRTGEILPGSLNSFLCLFAFGSICLSAFIFFYSAFRSALASIFTLLLSVGSIAFTDQGISIALAKIFADKFSYVYKVLSWFFSAFGEWVLLAFERNLVIDIRLLVLKTILVVVFFIVVGSWNLRRHVERAELY